MSTIKKLKFRIINGREMKVTARQKINLRLLTILITWCVAQSACAFSFDLDSIAAKGQFLNFCVKSYRGIDRFFNATDTVYVQSTGYRWNVKIRGGSWTDFNSFYFDKNHQIDMMSSSCVSIGADVQYMAVALGYDINLNRLFGGKDRSKSRFNFEFSSALFSGRLYSISNKDGMALRSVNNEKVDNLEFKGMNTSSWGADITYFFNHRRYSNQAAYSFGKIQKKSQGAFMTGLTFQSQKLDFDFSQLPKEIKDRLPENWHDRNYRASGWNLGISGGYGYNWVPKKDFLIGVMGLVIPSLHYGYINSDSKNCSFRLNYRLNASAVWNHNRWFVGLAARGDLGFIYSHSTLATGLCNFEMKTGWRF